MKIHRNHAISCFTMTNMGIAVARSPKAVSTVSMRRTRLLSNRSSVRTFQTMQEKTGTVIAPLRPSSTQKNAFLCLLLKRNLTKAPCAQKEITSTLLAAVSAIMLGNAHILSLENG